MYAHTYPLCPDPAWKLSTVNVPSKGDAKRGISDQTNHLKVT